MSDDLQTDTVFDQTLADELSKSRAAFENYTRTLSAIDRELIGVYYGYPPQLEGKVAFWRAGLKSSPTAQAFAHMLRQQGWRDAPRGTKHRGTEFYDGDDGGLILMCPLDVHARMHEVQEHARRKRANGEITGLDGFAKEAAAMGVVVEQFDVRVGTATGPDVSANVKDSARARQQNRR